MEQLQEGLNEWLPIVQQPKTLFVVKTLEPNTSYQFRIIAYNEYGPGLPSNPSQNIFTKSTNKGTVVIHSVMFHLKLCLLGFLTAASPSFRKKMPPVIRSSESDTKGTGMTSSLHHHWLHHVSCRYTRFWILVPTATTPYGEHVRPSRCESVIITTCHGRHRL